MEIVTYVDFVDSMGYAHKAGLRSGTGDFLLSTSIFYQQSDLLFRRVPKKMRGFLVTYYFMTRLF